jgi:hypothetical protein
MQARTALSATLDAITDISPEYQVKTWKQVSTHPDGVNTDAPTVRNGVDESWSAK